MAARHHVPILVQHLGLDEIGQQILLRTRRVIECWVLPRFTNLYRQLSHIAHLHGQVGHLTRATAVYAALLNGAAAFWNSQGGQRFERHVETHDLAPQGGNCVVSLTLNSAGYIAAMNLSKCATKAQAAALARLGAALPFPSSSTVSREVSLRL